MGERHSVLTSLSSVIGEYLSLKTDGFRKALISGLSVGFSRALSVVVMVMLLLIVLAIFAFAFILLVGDFIGSQAVAALIVGSVLLMSLIVLFLMRKRLFLNMFTGVFSEVAESFTHKDDLKPLGLALVRALRDLLGE